MIVAVNSETGKAVLKFDNTTEAGIWSKLPTPDIEIAMAHGESLYGYRYINAESGYETVPSWQEQEMGERSVDVVYALSLITNLNREGMVYDVRSSALLTPAQVYDKYWQGVTAHEIFSAMVASIETNNKMLDFFDEQKKELQQCIIAQPETNKRGEKCVYVPLGEAHDVVDSIRQDLGIEGEVAIPVWEEEGYIGKHKDVCYFAVKELNKPFSFEEWRGELLDEEPSTSK